MKKNKKKKAFTLIELLAVIIILGVLMLVAVPSVTGYISNSRKEAYINTAKEYVNSFGLEMEVIESVPVSEDIKLRRGDYARHIENFKKNIKCLTR